tara:strand:+ start:643 stop:1722 length:1080 start_codon:yes stop_codon:yes gene_type:complete
LKKVFISVTNDLVTDQRVHKVASSLLKKGYDVLLIGTHGNKIINRNYNCHQLKTYYNKGFLFYLEFNIKLFVFLLFNHCNILLSNDLDTLLPNYLISKLKNKPLVYDSHELFTEVPELLNRPLVKSVWLYIERLCLPNLKYSYTVSESIADYYRSVYQIKMSVVRNFPLTRYFDIQQKDKKDKIIIYQGAINKDRGVELMILAMKYLDAKLYIVGGGDLLLDMKQLSRHHHLDKKVVFFGKKHFSELLSITQTADLGLSFEEDTCLAYRCSLPNKIFDYVNAEIPVLVSDLPEFKKIINQYGVGAVLKSRDPKIVAEQINMLLSSSSENMFSQIKLAKKEFSWLNEEKTLLSIFNRIPL